LDIRIDLGFNLYMRQRVRLYGVDTKEIFGPKRVPAGQKSKEFTKQWVADAEAKGLPFRLSIRRYNDREKYGRILAIVFSGDDPVSLNDALIAAGLAVHTPKTWGLPEEVERADLD
jgi:micrococcal nuclease